MKYGSIDPFDDVVKVAMREYSIYADYVFCGNCEEYMLVNCGEEICPLCGSTGNLADVIGQPREVEVNDSDFLSRNVLMRIN